MEGEALPGGVARVHEWIELAALGVDILAAVVIVIGMVVGTLGFLAHWRPRTQVPEFLEGYRKQVGRTLLLALELLVAADILETIVSGPTLQEVAGLLLLVIVRTFLSWSLELEIDHRWPWQPEPRRPLAEALRHPAGGAAEE
ncbi:MAG: DUF1622 domain-containing protein [Chloroflexota bacterium]